MMVAGLFLFAFLQIHGTTQHLISPRISNGKDTQLDQFPFMASIQLSYLFIVPYFHLCCGVSIDKYWVISTGMCVKATMKLGRYRIKIGLYYTEIEHAAVETFKIAERFVHKETNKTYKTNNIGLFKLDNPINHHETARLGQQKLQLTDDEVLMLGWGDTKPGVFGTTPVLLQQGEVRVMDNEECESLISQTGVVVKLHDTQMCVNSPGKAVSACAGDAGGPVIRYDANRKPEVVAIVSWIISPCNVINAPTITTRTAPYKKWIDRTIAETKNPAADTDDLTVPLLGSYLLKEPRRNR